MMWWFGVVAVFVLLALVKSGKADKRQSGHVQMTRTNNSSNAKPITIKVTSMATSETMHTQSATDALRKKEESLILKEHESITRGLIIAQPWIGYILRGEKSWEMRSRNSQLRGPIALIEKGTGTVVGIARLTEVKGPFTPEQLAEHEHLHRVPGSIYQSPDYKWHYAWVLQDVHPLPSPVPYQHKSGAVIWVELDANAQQGIAAQLQSVTAKPECTVNPSEEVTVTRVPVARDGTHFCPIRCARNGHYTVGEKGAEQRFSDYYQALNYLEAMPVAKWRRPNTNGNWGIVSAVEWVKK
ncbi:ASCH domain-containing protein [Oceanimonas sp. CHS3-5]|uniref:ASCH domain-containing protein n=1 Tax=Oceanimonas sp. CHS3-5 TaxID=3068186 RepID=UPI00273FB7F9|nr:ASCH domain-containing protein [Oceanimonas sp. CHS3-5]MDP5293553.1 ASCH domain-containing protein [Oceanimonas sp. CHS3-5]